MSTSLHEFATDEKDKLEKFVIWYEAKNKENPEHFPLTLPSENEGAWFEMLIDFDSSSEHYQLPHDNKQENTDALNEDEQDIKGFHWHSDSWYGKDDDLIEGSTDHLNIGFYVSDGTTDGEFSIHWEKLDGDIVPRLKAYDDGWGSLVNMPELLKYMESVNDQNTQISEFVDNLLKLGFKDLTKRVMK
jgi:hypothetical protein